MLLEAVARGAGMVLNLGAGLDTRPYRLALPSTLRWIEGERLGRPLPLPRWFVPVHSLLPRRAREAIRRMIGYARLEPT